MIPLYVAIDFIESCTIQLRRVLPVFQLPVIVVIFKDFCYH